MKIGIGIPNTMLDAPGEVFAEWGRRAEERGFSTLASIGRIAYPSHDELLAFANIASVTERIGFLTNILLAPAFPTALLAKSTATLDRLSGGRFTLGVGVGARPDDFAAAGAEFAGRGRRFDDQLKALHAAWKGETLAGGDNPVAPTATNGAVPMAFGGGPQAAAPRAVRWDGGYTIGGAPADQAAEMAKEFRQVYADLGGTGTPSVVALFYFSLGDEHTEESLRNLRSYYGNLPDWVEAIAQGAARSAQDIRDRIAAYEEGGVDEVVLDPTVATIDQVDRVADVVFG